MPATSASGRLGRRGFALEIQPTTNRAAMRVGPKVPSCRVESNQAMFSRNAYYDGSWKRLNADYSSAIRMYNDPGDGSIAFHIAASGAVGATLPNWDSTDVRMVIRNSGNVGIGTTGPGAKLTVKATDGATGGIRLDNSNGYGSMVNIHQTGSDGYVDLYTGNNPTVLRTRIASYGDSYFNSGGNVGIGTTVPSVKLHVAGNAFFDLPGGTALERNLTIKNAGTAQIGFGSYPGAWTPALQIQNNDNTRYVWISPLDNASGGNARLVTGGTNFDIMPGNVQAATFTTGGNVGIGTTGANS